MTTMKTTIMLVIVFLSSVTFFLLVTQSPPVTASSSQSSAASTGSSCAADDGSGSNSEVDGTCISTTMMNTSEDGDEEPTVDQDDGKICFPDGNCFESMMEADAKYAKRGRNLVTLEVPVVHSEGQGEQRIVNYGDAQQVAGPDWKKTMDVIQQTHGYMELVHQNETAVSYRDECKCRHELCAFWASIGECENNPKYMLLHCAPVCQTCHQISFEHRCPFDNDAPTVWQQGDLQKMFERITTEQYYVDQFNPTILSQDPWIVTLDNVATKEECERMIKLGSDRGYERSKDVGKQ